METLLITLVLKYTTNDNLDLDKICADVNAQTLTIDNAQAMVDYQNDKLNGYEIQIPELCAK